MLDFLKSRGLKIPDDEDDLGDEGEATFEPEPTRTFRPSAEDYETMTRAQLESKSDDLAWLELTKTMKVQVLRAKASA